MSIAGKAMAEKKKTDELSYNVQYLPIDNIAPYWRNPRKNQKTIARVVESIKEFGWRNPIIVDKNRVIIAGHVRFEAAKEIGMKEVPVHIADELSPAQAQAYRIVDNSSAEVSEWDEGALLDELAELESQFSAELLGFDIQEPVSVLDDLKEWDFSLVEDEYIVTIKGPLPMQDEVRHRLKGMENVTIEVGHIIRTTRP